MENTPNFIAISQETEKFLLSIRGFFEKSKDNALLSRIDEIPKKAFAEEEKISIVFAGQYSAGKSTILNILTGANLKVGEGIETQTTTELDWYGMKVIDTPGIHTQIRPDHDKITYEAISKADLIVYVITNSLFEPCIYENFRKLAFTCDKKNEIMLVVNKMEGEELGNCAESRRIKIEALSETLAPASPEDFMVTCIDAESFLDAKKAEKERVKEKKLIRSNINELTKNLDSFAKKKGLSGKMSTALYTAEHILQELINTKSTGDNDADATREFIYRQQRVWVEARQNIKLRSDEEITNLLAFVRKQGDVLVDKINDNTTKAVFEGLQQDSQDKINIQYAATISNIQKIIDDEYRKVSQNQKDLFDSDFTKRLIENLETRFKDNPQNTDRLSGKIKMTGKYSEQFGKWVISNLQGSNSSAKGLSLFTGSNVHDTVLKLGHLFGHKFKPYEALKWTKGIGNAAKGLAIVGIVTSVAFQIKEDADAEKKKDLDRSNRENIRCAYLDLATKTGAELRSSIDKIISNDLQKDIDDMEKKLEEINNIEKSQSIIYQGLVDLRSQAANLIHKVHDLSH